MASSETSVAGADGTKARAEVDEKPHHGLADNTARKWELEVKPNWLVSRVDALNPCEGRLAVLRSWGGLRHRNPTLHRP